MSTATIVPLTRENEHLWGPWWLSSVTPLFRLLIVATGDLADVDVYAAQALFRDELKRFSDVHAVVLMREFRTVSHRLVMKRKIRNFMRDVLRNRLFSAGYNYGIVKYDLLDKLHSSVYVDIGPRQFRQRYFRPEGSNSSFPSEGDMVAFCRGACRLLESRQWEASFFIPLG